MTTIPSIACLGVIGKNNNPLHISIFPPHTTPYPLSSSSPKSTPPVHESLRTPLQYSLLLSSTLDIFDARSRTSGAQNLTGDLGLLYAVDERLAAYGFETNTGVRFVVFVDARGRVVRGGVGVGGAEGNAREGVVGGVREVDVRSIFKAMQAAYIRLLQNPFYDPDEHCPVNGKGGKKIVSRLFIEDMRRIGEGWVPGSPWALIYRCLYGEKQTCRDERHDIGTGMGVGVGAGNPVG
ncbi:hypothetical protein EYC84_006008 [Monilinia fructicola]|uniref:Trafficking protein particle complex subunit n=1 Tax=Monilinia fructicola TaxID=38448 RepID=A0A5M9K2B0_MONFR|nr:hypothetical protein EYC84_006008 [Monilinia fructicola]